MITIDIGSSDIWIDSNLWCHCKAGDLRTATMKDAIERCTKIEAHLAKKDKPEEIKYADDFTVEGHYVNGSLQYSDSGKILKAVSFLAATSFSGTITTGTNNVISGMVGLGYIRNQKSDKKYHTLPYILRERKETSSLAFSMWFEQTSGKEDSYFDAQLLFGAYAKGLYKKRPETFNIIGEEVYDAPTEIKIDLNKISVRDNTVWFPFSKSGGLKVLLDTGTYSSWLPLETFNAIANLLGTHTTHRNTERVYALYPDCSTWNLTTEMMNFQFGQTIISVPFSEIVRRVEWDEIVEKGYSGLECVTHGMSNTFSYENRILILVGIAAYADTYSWAIFNGYKGVPPDLSQDWILGVTFLRYAYILYDLVDNKVHMAAINQTAVEERKKADYAGNLYTLVDGLAPSNFLLPSSPNQ
jgi:hypothetical protein